MDERTLVNGITLSSLIQESLDQGWDVKITFRRRDDGKEGELSIPASWARRLGIEDQSIRK